MSANVQQSAALDSISSLVLEPFHSNFDPLHYSRSKSHFQLAFAFVIRKKRRQALKDFYAYCRVVDDLADREELEVEKRKLALAQIERWLKRPNEFDHPFWSRLAAEIEELNLPISCFQGIIRGVRYDFQKPLRFQTWDDLNDYVQGVACDVGEVVLNILGATGPEAHDYSQKMGRCVQYLNIMRDLEEDLRHDRVYYPQKEIQKSEAFKNGQFVEHKLPIIRENLFEKAMNYKKQAKAFSLNCFAAEIMVGIYSRAGRRYWRYGQQDRLSTFEKLTAAIESGGEFLLRRRR